VTERKVAGVAFGVKQGNAQLIQAAAFGGAHEFAPFSSTLMVHINQPTTLRPVMMTK
jgi:hypothetical protein